MNKYNKRLAHYVNEHYDIRDLYEEVMHRAPGSGKCFCPFHHNVNTPAAKVYGNALKCFGVCQRMYYPYDFLAKWFPDELAKVKSTVLLNDNTKEFKALKPIAVDRSQPLVTILKTIISLNEEGTC